jgi:hypothetical protein
MVSTTLDAATNHQPRKTRGLAAVRVGSAGGRGAMGKATTGASIAALGYSRAAGDAPAGAASDGDDLIAADAFATFIATGSADGVDDRFLGDLEAIRLARPADHPPLYDAA